MDSISLYLDDEEGMEAIHIHYESLIFIHHAAVARKKTMRKNSKTLGESRSIFTSLGSFIFKEFVSLDDDAFAPFEEET